MAEHSIHRSASQSSIPVVTPRPSRSSVSSTFPPPQSSLVPQLRRTSESTTQPISASIVALPQTPVSSIPSFRSLRNLLPFAPAKTSNLPSSPTHTPKPSFVSFGSLRRITHDRKSSVAHPPPQEVEQAPVIAIARPSQTFEEEMMARKRSRDFNRSTSDLSPSSRKSDERYGICSRKFRNACFLIEMQSYLCPRLAHHWVLTSRPSSRLKTRVCQSTYRILGTSRTQMETMTRPHHLSILKILIRVDFHLLIRERHLFSICRHPSWLQR